MWKKINQELGIFIEMMEEHTPLFGFGLTVQFVIENGIIPHLAQRWIEIIFVNVVSAINKRKI